MARKTLFKCGVVTTILAFLIVVHVAKDRIYPKSFTREHSTSSMRKNDLTYSIDTQSENYHGSQRRLLNSAEECRHLHNINDTTARCHFVNTTEDCKISDGFFDYNYFTYCTLMHIVQLATVILFLWWLFCFIGLAVTADDFFCPALVVISKTLHLSPNIAGVTFLAFGNGAPDLFSAIVAFTAMKGSGDTGLAIGGLFGAGMFVTTVVVGSISIIKPFKAMERPFLRDIIFYLVGVYWTFFILWRQRIYLYEAIGFMCLYILYVVVVVISGLIYRKQKKAADRKKAGETGDIKLQSIKRKISSGADSAPAEIENSLQKALYLDLSPEHVGHDNFSFEEGTGKRYFTRQDSELSMLPVTPSSPASPNSVSSVTFNLNGDLASNERLSLRSSNSTSDLINNEIKHSMDPIFEKEIQTEKDALENFEAPPTPFRQFLLAICPISLDDWPEMGIIGKVYEIFKSPIQFILTITIPVVNYDVEETHNWNRHLNILHCFWTPTVFILLLQGIDVKIAGVFPIYGLTLLLGLALAIIVFLTSKNETKPKYHWVFGYAGFLGSMVWIYTIANEIVNLLENFGLVFNISNAILGLTLLAWGNSIGDFISNITMSSQGFSRMGFAACFGAPSFNMIANIAMARQGFSRMGFAACYGAPSFNLLLGVGIPFLTSMLQDEETSAELKLTSQQLVLSFFLLASLVSSLVLLPLFRFKAGKVYGIYLITLYLVFLVVALLVEARVIKF